MAKKILRGKLVKTSLVLEDRQMTALERQAIQEQVSISHLVRRAVDKMLANGQQVQPSAKT